MAKCKALGRWLVRSSLELIVALMHITPDKIYYVNYWFALHLLHLQHNPTPRTITAKGPGCQRHGPAGGAGV